MEADRARALEEMRSLNLPPAFVALWEGVGPSRFLIQYRAPHAFFRHAGDPRFASYVPLLEMNREVLYAYDKSDGVYVEHYYEDPQPTVIGSGYQQLLAWLLVDLGYAGLEEVAAEVAPLLGFEHARRLSSFLIEEDDNLSSELVAKRRFIESLAGTAQ